METSAPQKSIENAAVAKDDRIGQLFFRILAFLKLWEAGDVAHFFLRFFLFFFKVSFVFFKVSFVFFKVSFVFL